MMNIKLLILLLFFSNSVFANEVERVITAKQIIYGSTAISIPFEFDRKKINSFDILKLNAISSLMKKNDDISVIIIGHTDNVGSDYYNHNLAFERATEASVFLEKEFGLKKEKIVVKSRGELDPIASNKTEVGRRLNRRIDIYIPSFREDIITK